MQETKTPPPPDDPSMCSEPQGTVPTLSHVARYLGIHSKRLLIFSLFSGLLLLAVVPWMLLIWDFYQERIVQSRQSAGHFVAAGWQEHGSNGWVQTDRGMYFVKTPLSSGFQEALWLQTRAQGSRFLCDAQGNCTRLLD